MGRDSKSDRVGRGWGWPGLGLAGAGVGRGWGWPGLGLAGVGVGALANWLLDILTLCFFLFP